jgi:hypothetical protein
LSHAFVIQEEAIIHRQKRNELKNTSANNSKTVVSEFDGRDTREKSQNAARELSSVTKR